MEAGRALIVGCGAVAVDHHLPRIRDLLGMREVVLVERDADRRAWLSRTVGCGRGLRTAEAVPEGRFALSVIATPPASHADVYAEVALRSEVVLIEKPLALGAAKALAIARHAEEHGIPVLVNLIRRGLGSYRLLRSLGSAGRFGALRGVSLREGGVFTWNAASLGSFSREQGGGGVLMDTGPHALDLLLQVFDDLALEACWTDAEGRGVEANCTLALRADGAVPVTVELSRNRYLDGRCVFEFEYAVCRLDVRDEGIEVHERDGSHYEIRPPGSTPGPTSFGELFDRFYRDRIRGGDRTGVRPADSVVALRVIEDAYAAAEPMRGLGAQF